MRFSPLPADPSTSRSLPVDERQLRVRFCDEQETDVGSLFPLIPRFILYFYFSLRPSPFTLTSSSVRCFYFYLRDLVKLTSVVSSLVPLLQARLLVRNPRLLRLAVFARIRCSASLVPHYPLLGLVKPQRHLRRIRIGRRRFLEHYSRLVEYWFLRHLPSEPFVE